MEEPYTEGVVTHGGPKSCIGVRKGVCEALTGVRTGAVLSREITFFGVPTLLTEAEGHTFARVSASWRTTPRGRRPAARTEPFCARTGRSHIRPPWMARRAAPGRPEAEIW